MQKWEKEEGYVIDYDNQIISLSVDHLSLFAIHLTQDILGIGEVIIYPNPYYSDKVYANTSGKIKIDFLPEDYSGLEIKVYDISGRLVKDFASSDVVEGFNNYILWDAKDKWGGDLATGVYIVLVKEGGSFTTHKIAIIQ